MNLEAVLLAAFFGGFLFVLGGAAGFGVAVWIAERIVCWLERKRLLP